MLAGGDGGRQPDVEEDCVGGMSLGTHKSAESRWCVGRFLGALWERRQQQGNAGSLPRTG